MAGYTEKEFVNILVLGSSNIKISQFVKLFSAYLKYDTCKEVGYYEPGLKSEVENVKETTSSVVSIGKHNFHFIDTPGLPKSYKNFKEIYNILSFFKAGCHLHAIIQLIEPDKKEDENDFEQYTTYFFSGLKQFSKNILHIVLYNDSCMYHQTYRKLHKMLNINLNIITEKSNVFHLNEDTFYKLSDDNWEESVKFCRSIFNYIIERVLKSSYVQCVLPPGDSFLNLAYSLLVILVEIYFWANQNEIYQRFFYVNDYVSNAIVCYGSNCFKWKDINSKKIQIKVPKICHDKCNCMQTCLAVKSCSVFDTTDKNCSVCNCDFTLHQRSIYNKLYSTETPKNMKQEKSIAISTLTQLFLLVKSYIPISMDDLIPKEFLGYAGCKVITENFNREFEAELKINLLLPVTSEKLLRSIYKLYEINEVTTIIPKIINEHFPKGLRLQAIPNPSGSEHKNELKVLKGQIKSMKIMNDNMKAECEAIKTKYANAMEEMTEIKEQLNKMANFTKDNNLSKGMGIFNLQNCDNFNIEEDEESTSDSSSNESKNSLKK